MRRSPGIVRLDVVEPNECVIPAAPRARSLDSGVRLVASTVHHADGDEYVRRPEIRLERRARVRRFLRIRLSRLDLCREHPIGVFDETGKHTRVV